MVEDLFHKLNSSDGTRMLPPDVREIVNRLPGHQRSRVVCDFIAGMTDRYCVEYYGRLVSERPQTIFKPL